MRNVWHTTLFQSLHHFFWIFPHHLPFPTKLPQQYFYFACMYQWLRWRCMCSKNCLLPTLWFWIAAQFTTTVRTHLSIVMNALAWKWLLFIFMKKDSSFHFFFSCRQVFLKSKDLPIIPNWIYILTFFYSRLQCGITEYHSSQQCRHFGNQKRLFDCWEMAAFGEGNGKNIAPVIAWLPVEWKVWLCKYYVP